jgi:hypothetical protein
MQRYRISFRHALGARVTYGSADGPSYLIVQQRYTIRPDLGPVLEYLLHDPDDRTRTFWALEPDVLPWETVP